MGLASPSHPESQPASCLLWVKKMWGEESAEWEDVKTWNEGRLVALLAKYETILEYAATVAGEGS